MSWLSSVLTPAGQNAANTDRDRKSAVQKTAANLLPDISRMLQESLASILEMATPQGQADLVRRQRTAAIGAARDQSNLTRQLLQ